MIEFLKKEERSLSEGSLSALSKDGFDQISGVETYESNHSAAWCILPEIQARMVAQALKAKRGFEIPVCEVPSLFD